uniref:Uncharacterized protein n=1 Tax=Arundo donax TaxID=35708 RepID=A0A0A8ZVV5_ARUDO
MKKWKRKDEMYVCVVD